MELVALVGRHEDVTREAHRRWRKEGVCMVGMLMYVKKAAQAIYGLTDDEAFSDGDDIRIERLGMTNRELFEQLADKVGRGVIHAEIARTFDMLRPSEGVTVVTDVAECDMDFLGSQGAAIVAV